MEQHSNRPNQKKQIIIKYNDKQIQGIAYQTTPLMVELELYAQIDSSVIAAKVNGKLYNLYQPLQEDCCIEFLKFDDNDGKKVFWNTTLFLLGMACENLFNCKISGGSTDNDGFFIDIDTQDKISENMLVNIGKKVKEIAKKRFRFERLEMSKDDLLKMFADNPYKLHHIQTTIPDNSSGFAYKCDKTIDFIDGPTLIHTGPIKVINLCQLSGAYWLGNSKNKTLTRIHGISFPDKQKLQIWEKIKEEAMLRDHRLIGKQQKLFMFHDFSPGSCFFLPHGTIIYNNLVNFIKTQYRNRGFKEVMTPNIYNIELWKISGHWEHYSENMFSLENHGKHEKYEKHEKHDKHDEHENHEHEKHDKHDEHENHHDEYDKHDKHDEPDKHENNEEECYALKPMNCPGHCLIFGSMSRSYRELPLRLADFGALHRNELRGALTGLTRVRRFCQDDAHIYCTDEQIEEEISNCLNFLNDVYKIFGFEFELALSTRPKKYIGNLELWNRAETQLENSLNKSGHQWKFKPEDGAFYGPKIDIMLKDAMQRSHQCGTIQLDFNLPEKFDLKYVTKFGTEKRPVMIHRAILGSVERMIAVLIEHYAGKWPFWLSPRQICIIPVDPIFNDYAQHVYQIYHDAGFHVEIDNGDNKLSKKIRNAQLEQFNLIFVVGKDEEEKKGVNIRNRNGQVTGLKTHSEALEQLSLMKNSYQRD